MPSDTVGNVALVPFTGDSPPAVYPLHHGLAPPISRLSISWARGSSLRLSLFAGAAAKVVEVKLAGEDSEIPDAHWRRIAYGSVAPFALLQSRRSSLSALLKTPSPYRSDWWEHVLQYSKEIGSLLGGPKLPASPIIEDPNVIAKRGEEPTSLKAAWELIEIFYVDKQSQAWLPERLVDWLADYASLFTSTHETIHGKLVDFQKELVNIQIHSKKRNRLEHKRLHDLVFVKYNQQLKQRYNARDEIDPISLNDIDVCNEWLVGEMDQDDDNDAGNDLVFEDDDALNWATVYQASGVGECRMYTRRKKQKTSVAAAQTSKKQAMVVGSSSRKQKAVQENDEDLDAEENIDVESEEEEIMVNFEASDGEEGEGDAPLPYDNNEDDYVEIGEDD